MKYNFSFLNKLGPQWKKVVYVLEESQANLEFDYKQAVFTSLRCSNLIIQSLITEYKLDDKQNFIKNIEQLKKIKVISDALYTKFKFIYTIAHKAKYMENEIITKSEAEMCMSSVYTIMSWYVNKKTKNNIKLNEKPTKPNEKNRTKTNKGYNLDFLPRRLEKLKNNMAIAQESLQRDPENTLIKCRTSMEIVVEDLANQEGIKLKTDRLYDNIEKIKDVLPQDIYFSMQSTRTLGNIGGHKNEKNIDKLRMDANVCLQVTYRTLYWFSKDYKSSTLNNTNDNQIKDKKEDLKNNKKIEQKKTDKKKQEVKKEVNSKSNKPKRVFEKWGTSGEYIGYVVDGKRHGQGKMMYTTGDIYDGEWHEDKRHGQGKMRYTDGTYYDGEWKNNLKDGKAKRYRYANGNIYTGNIKKGKAHGNGTMKYVDGSIYEGMWKENKKHGQGKLQYTNGDIYIGEFQNDKCHGPGTMRYKDGREFNGIWENNEIVNSKVFSSNITENDKSSIGNFIGKLFGR